MATIQEKMGHLKRVAKLLLQAHFETALFFNNLGVFASWLNTLIYDSSPEELESIKLFGIR
jgi:hypothetical protein